VAVWRGHLYPPNQNAPQMTELTFIGNTAGPALPALIAGAGERAAWRFLEFFTVNIRNKNTRAAYARAAAGLPALVRRAGDWRARARPSRCTSRPTSSNCNVSGRLHGQATSGLYPDAVRLAGNGSSDAVEPGALRTGSASFGKQGFNAGPLLRGSNCAAHRHGCFNGCRPAGPRRYRRDDIPLRPCRCRGALAVEDYFPQKKRWWLRLREKKREGQ